MYQDDGYFTYQVLSDEEIRMQRGLLEEGIHPFEVINAERQMSKTNKPMVVLTLKVWGKEGRVYIIKDWIVLIPTMLYKLKHFWDSVGHPEFYNGKAREGDFIGKCGHLRSRISKNNRTGDDMVMIPDYLYKKESNDYKPHDDDHNNDLPEDNRPKQRLYNPEAVKDEDDIPF